MTRVASVLVANDAGGCGKTLSSMLLVRGRVSARAVGFDRSRSSGPSKLARLLAADGRQIADDFVSDRRVSEVSDKSEIAEAYASVGDAVLQGGAVVDTGSKGAGGLADWCVGAGAGGLLRDEGVPVWIVVPTTASTTSLRSARDAIERLGARGVFDAYPPVVVFNGLHGEFDEIEHNVDLDWIQGRVASGRVKCVVMPKCRGSVLAFLEAERLGFDEALAIAPAEFARRFDVPEARALWWLRCFAEFVAGVLAEFSKVGIVREPVAERTRFLELDRAWESVSMKLLGELMASVQASTVSADERPSGILRKINREDAALLAEAFPDTVNVLGQQIYGAMQRGLKPNFAATRRAVEAAFLASEARQGRTGIHPRLGPYRRNVVLEAKRRGLDVGSHRVAAVSYFRIFRISAMPASGGRFGFSLGTTPRQCSCGFASFAGERGRRSSTEAGGTRHVSR